MDLDGLLELGELNLPIGDDAAPFAQSRQRRHGLPVAADFLFRFTKMHHVAPFAENARASHAWGAAADHQHGTRFCSLREFLGMPATAIFLADGHVLGAHDLPALLKLRHANVAADALADVLHPAFRNLGRQERIGDRRAGGADDVQHAGAYQSDHVVGAGEPAIADHGYILAQDRLTLADEWRHPAGFAEARRACILAPFGVIADFQRHGVNHAFIAEQLEHSYAILMSLDSLRPVQSVDLEARRDAAPIAERALQRVQQLDEKSRPVGKASAVAIGPPVEARLEKLHGQRVVSGGDFQQIESGLFGALSGLDIHVDHAPDVELIHFAAVHRTRGKYRRQPLARRAAELA